jgi:hypothetical protein
MVQPTVFNLTTLVLLGLTGWILWVRHRMRLETNWPLFYYLGLVIYMKKYVDTVNPNYAFVAIVSALLLRFEFMGGWPLKIVKAVETVLLVYIIVRCIQVVFRI